MCGGRWTNHTLGHVPGSCFPSLKHCRCLRRNPDSHTLRTLSLGTNNLAPKAVPQSANLDLSLLLCADESDGRARADKWVKPPPESRLHVTGLPKERVSKWSHQETFKLFQLRQTGMGWKEVSDNLPGRTVEACRLRFRSYLRKLKSSERRGASKGLPRIMGTKCVPEDFVRFKADLTVRSSSWSIPEAMFSHRGGQPRLEPPLPAEYCHHRRWQVSDDRRLLRAPEESFHRQHSLLPPIRPSESWAWTRDRNMAAW